MASDEIVLDGVTCVRSRDAARIVQRGPDYVSTLARGGLVKGTRVDGLWFVNLASLQEFVADQERQKELWRAQLAEQRLVGQATSHGGYPHLSESETKRSVQLTTYPSS